MRRLLDHSRVHRVPPRPVLAPGVVRVDEACEPRVRGFGGAREFVKREGEGQGGECEVETALWGCQSRKWMGRRKIGGRGGRWKMKETAGRRTPRDSLTGSGWWPWETG